MRTTISLDADVHEFASVYAAAKGMTLSAAIGELIRRAQSAKPEDALPAIRRAANGFPLFPRGERPITSAMVKQALEED